MNKKTVYDKSIKQPLRQNNEVNLSTFGYLISEYIQYTMNKKRNIEQELQKFGESIGIRMYELIIYRERQYKKETKHIEILKYISSTIWSTLFGKIADKLGSVGDQEHAYFIQDDSPLILKYISEEQGKAGASLIVGMIKGILNSAGYPTENVDYVDYEIEEDGTSSYPKTQFYIKFDPQVILREKN